MCTHLLLEAEGLAEKVVVLDGGTDLIAGAPDELTQRFWPGMVVKLDAEDPADLDRLRGAEGVLGYERDDRGVAAAGAGAGSGGATVQLDDLARVPDLVRELAEAGVRLTRVEPRIPTLEDLYFAVRDGREAFSEKGHRGDRHDDEKDAPHEKEVAA
jgi:ABC-type multidrug transport system ATPase subunit